MALHRRQLPIVSPCTGFEGRAATDHAPAFCTRCAKPVHDVARLTERELVTLLARHLGGELCLSYRTRVDGTIVTRSAPSRLAPAAIAASLAGCAGHLGDADARAPDCIDADGYRRDCPPPPRLDQPVIPDAIEAPPPDDAPAEIRGPDGVVETVPQVHELGETTVGVVIVDPVAAPIPSAPPPVMAEPAFRGGISLGGVDTVTQLDAELSRRVKREGRRIERRERRQRARRERAR